MTSIRRILAAAFALSAMAGGDALADVPVPPPVAVVACGRLAVSTPAATGEFPVSVSQDWSHPLPAVRRAVIIVHGYARNAADYARIVLRLAPADTLVVAPQFLALEDIAAHRLPDDTLRWRRGAWSGGWPAQGPAPLSSFDALDALLARLGNRAILPHLSRIVLAGFSAGGQLVQRYAVAGKGEGALGSDGIALRYVVGSPSSYLYFGDERPRADGTFTRFADAAACPEYHRWKYGFGGDLPPYVVALKTDPAALERRYAMRDVVYLLGAADTDPNHRFLDKTCAGEAQGPTRVARGLAYFAAMRRRDGAILRHVLVEAPGAAHQAARVLGSPCGRAALFDATGCPGLR